MISTPIISRSASDSALHLTAQPYPKGLEVCKVVLATHSAPEVQLAIGTEDALRGERACHESTGRRGGDRDKARQHAFEGLVISSPTRIKLERTANGHHASGEHLSPHATGKTMKLIKVALDPGSVSTRLPPPDHHTCPYRCSAQAPAQAELHNKCDRGLHNYCHMKTGLQLKPMRAGKKQNALNQPPPKANGYVH